MPGPRTTALVGIAASVALHGAVALALARVPARRLGAPAQASVEVAVVERVPPPPEPPKPPPERKPDPPRPVPRSVKPKVVVRTLARANPTPPPPQAAPPPPSVEAKQTTPNPTVLPGITLESTMQGGRFAAQTGNTLYGDPGRSGHDPKSVKPYKAARYAAPGVVTEPLSVAYVPDLRDFYPPEARKAEFEADVHLRLMVDSDGSVVKVEPLSDPGRGLAAAAVRAARLIRFHPAKVGGEAVATSTPFTLQFIINN